MKLSVKSKIIASVSCACLAICMVPAAAFADSGEIVTIGADLTADERAQVLEFFGLSEDSLSDVEVINVTNADEHSYCDATIPSSVTGTRTLSCSYIQPTTSGGIHVETANLTYVTSSALYNALQTAGVENCNLVVTAPYEVSGTGALTGVFMAYNSTGQTIDADKAATAIEELYVTSGLQEEYGDDMATAINEIKDDIVSATADMTDEEIEQLIRDKAAEYGVTLSDDEVASLLELLKKMQDMDYDVGAFATTLADMQSALSDMGDNASTAVSGIGGFFQGIIDFFSGLFGGASSASSDATNAASDAASSILNKLNTDVFQLDD